MGKKIYLGYILVIFGKLENTQNNQVTYNNQKNTTKYVSFAVQLCHNTIVVVIMMMNSYHIYQIVMTNLYFYQIVIINKQQRLGLINYYIIFYYSIENRFSLQQHHQTSQYYIIFMHGKKNLPWVHSGDIWEIREHLKQLSNIQQLKKYYKVRFIRSLIMPQYHCSSNNDDEFIYFFKYYQQTNNGH
eukprot:TRINITY_DN6602_c0_g5_i1.p1 TRINITY_DN6602_c0_g5~~TRINITY_DN6602_c0_g5_i1.p1  ORF type:complete len:187 (-),score=-15.49 TRINITY_DN6602_c0_g5_i1:449-1009(-)